jgi:3-oxoacyl-[acyl-carrier protein] reductase
MDLRLALITGGGSGIGAATALALAADGYSLWITYTTSQSSAESVADQCRQLGSPDVHVSHLDLRSQESIEALMDEVATTWTQLHALINNGAICHYLGYDDIDLDEWDDTMETNARGNFLITRAALPLLLAATGDRVIVNVASVAGQVGSVATGIHYAASKGAVLAISRSFARALAGEGIRVNSVAPGPITSKITDQLPAKKRESLASVVPLGRFGTPDEAAWLIASLVSPRASYVTGATYDVNGGVRID